MSTSIKSILFILLVLFMLLDLYYQLKIFFISIFLSLGMLF